MNPKKEKKKAIQPKQQSEIDSDAYNQVVSSTSMVDIRLVESKFCVKPEYYDEESESKHKFHSNRTVGEVVFANSDGFFYIPVNFEVLVKNSNRKDLVCTCEYIVLFHSDSKIQQTEAKLFAAKVGIHAAYPYFRSFLASQSWAAGADLPTLPILKQPPFKKKMPSKSN